MTLRRRIAITFYFANEIENGLKIQQAKVSRIHYQQITNLSDIRFQRYIPTKYQNFSISPLRHRTAITFYSANEIKNRLKIRKAKVSNFHDQQTKNLSDIRFQRYIPIKYQNFCFLPLQRRIAITFYSANKTEKGLKIRQAEVSNFQCKKKQTYRTQNSRGILPPSIIFFGSIKEVAVT